MADTTTNNDATSNTVKSKGSGTAAVTGGDDAAVNTTVVSGASSGEETVGVTPISSILPFPHTGITKDSTIEGTVYKDLIGDIYKEHEKELQKNSSVYEPTQEMLAARMDAQEGIATELRARLKAERVMRGFQTGAVSGGVKIKLKQDHTDSGVFYNKGDEIYVDKTTAKFLEDAKIAEKV